MEHRIGRGAVGDHLIDESVRSDWIPELVCEDIGTDELHLDEWAAGETLVVGDAVLADLDAVVVRTAEIDVESIRIVIWKLDRLGLLLCGPSSGEGRVEECRARTESTLVNREPLLLLTDKDVDGLLEVESVSF